MVENLLIIKKRGRNVQMKITQKMRSGYSPDHKLVVNLNNYKNVSQFFYDMKDLYGVPIDKAIAEYNKGRPSNWPF